MFSFMCHSLKFPLAELAHFICSRNFLEAVFFLFDFVVIARLVVILSAYFFEWCLQTAKIKFNFLEFAHTYRYTKCSLLVHTSHSLLHFPSHSIWHSKMRANKREKHIIRSSFDFFFFCVSLRSHFFDLNWIFFPIGTECNLIAHQITIKCLTAAYNVIVHAVPSLEYPMQTWTNDNCRWYCCSDFGMDFQVLYLAVCMCVCVSL